MAEGFDAAKLLKKVHDANGDYSKRIVVGNIHDGLMYYDDDGYRYYYYDHAKAMMKAGLVDTLVMMLTEWKFDDAHEKHDVMGLVIYTVKILTEMRLSWIGDSTPDSNFFTVPLLDAILPYIELEQTIMILHTIFNCFEFPEHLRDSVSIVVEALNSRIEKDPHCRKANVIHAIIVTLKEQVAGRRTKAARV